MASTYAHRCFGADVLTQLPEALQKKIEPYRALYDIGLHGPDLLFYYKALQSNPVNRLGNAMHEQPGTVFFERIFCLCCAAGRIPACWCRIATTR